MIIRSDKVVLPVTFAVYKKLIYDYGKKNNNIRTTEV